MSNTFNPDWLKRYEMVCPLLCPTQCTDDYETEDRSLHAGMMEMPNGKWYRVADHDRAIMEQAAEYQVLLAAKDAAIDKLKAEIEKLKCCGCCKHKGPLTFPRCTAGINFTGMIVCDKWESWRKA